ncbi:uncharacterized protein SPPG_04279 [Spizellomyces punctatus DAOM BR117]|uniref:Mitochondrial import inner membrane translocase subunit TIM50 n=1 Tax=Spizellomyces punctatus (strain DAOM BR117) TaxID=645134 RepID=A0A0L0HK40_SPIPD|nr:uncharacterized protein SPPG_04279 [Spizellomyces punctatus DAOM BR117]KND01189.1 hypothetical protein SPPG_04279 [Spizellomyces punctatus DAOM BR117]|eukprot:XP_016609228.1 hypothetical protein SPPG_04279 [Spizellomyces punctatus DAOM BR117]
MAKSRERKRRKMSGTKRRTILLILDINGTLLERVKKTAEKRAARANPLCPEAPNFRLNRARCYYRPYLDTFIDHIFQHFEVAAWTSAMPKNADPMFSHIFGDYASKLAFGWNRSHCSDIGGRDRDWEAKKDLRKVWADRTVNPHGRWTERNTILIDDTSSKASFTPANCLHLPTFTVCDPNFDCINDTSLLSLIKYLDALRQSDVTDVREYFKTHPAFHVADTGKATHPHEQFAIQDTEDEELISRFTKDRPRLADHSLSSSDEERPPWAAQNAHQSRMDRTTHPQPPFQRFEPQQSRGYHSQAYMPQHFGYHRHRSDDLSVHEGQTHRQSYRDRESFQRFESQQTWGYHSQPYVPQHSGYHQHRSDDLPVHEGQPHRQSYRDREPGHDSYGFYQGRTGTSSRHPVTTSDQRDFQRYENGRHQDVFHPSTAPPSNGSEGNWRQRADNEGSRPAKSGKGKKGKTQPPRANSKGRAYRGGKFSKEKRKKGGG